MSPSADCVTFIRIGVLNFNEEGYLSEVCDDLEELNIYNVQCVYEKLAKKTGPVHTSSFFYIWFLASSNSLLLACEIF